MTVLSTPRWWWDAIVMANYREFAISRTDDRKAFNAIVAMHHFPERIYWWNVERVFGKFDLTYDSRWGLFKERLKEDWSSSGIGQSMQVLEYAANAIKHTVTVKPKNFGLHELTATGGAMSVEGRDCYVALGDEPSVMTILDIARNFWEVHQDRYVTMDGVAFSRIIKV